MELFVLNNAKLTVKLEKWNFFRKMLNYLGVQISLNGIATDTDKTGAITPILPQPPPLN